MAVRSADKKPEKYIGPDGKPRIRMVPVDKEVVKNEAANASKEAQRHMQGMKDARADMKVAKSADAMTKAMNKLQHHTKAHKKAMAAMEEAYKEPQGQAKRMMSPLQKARMDKEKADRDRYGKLKPGVIKKKMANEAAPKIDDEKYAAHMARNKKPKTMTSTQKSLADISKRANEAKEVDEISLKDLSNTIAKSTGNKNLKKALKTDKLKADLAKMKMATEAKDPARTVSQLAIRDTNRRFDRAKKAAKKDDENSKYRTSKSGNVFVGLKKEAKDPEEYDKEGDMAKTQLKTMIDAAKELHDQLSDDENMPEWVQNKITKATDYIDSVRDYMKNNDDVNESYRITKIYNPSTKASRAAKKSTATYAVHTHDRKYFKEFPSQKDAEAHLKSLSKKESVQIDEISQDMKQRYMNRASQAATAATVASKYTKGKEKEKLDRIAKNRKAGVKKVVGEKTQLDEYGGPPISRAKYLKQKPMKERELTPGELKKREKYAKDLPDAEFKKRYGDRWKSVKIATATKMAKGEK